MDGSLDQLWNTHDEQVEKRPRFTGFVPETLKICIFCVKIYKQFFQPESTG